MFEIKMKRAILITAVAVLSLCAIGETGADVSDIKVEELRKPVSAKWGRDPFLKYDDRYKKAVKEAEFRPEEPITFKINGIISDGKKALAIVDGEFFRSGDTIAGFRIIDISGDKLLAEKDGRRVYIGVDRFVERIKGR